MRLTVAGSGRITRPTHCLVDGATSDGDCTVAMSFANGTLGKWTGYGQQNLFMLCVMQPTYTK